MFVGFFSCFVVWGQRWNRRSERRREVGPLAGFRVRKRRKCFLRVTLFVPQTNWNNLRFVFFDVFSPPKKSRSLRQKILVSHAGMSLFFLLLLSTLRSEPNFGGSGGKRAQRAFAYIHTNVWTEVNMLTFFFPACRKDSNAEPHDSETGRCANHKHTVLPLR